MTSTARPMRQEQQPADPEIAEVAPGVLRMQLPITMPGLGHVNCYALEDSRGVALVDPGLPGPASWKVLTARLAAAGFPLKRVHSIVVTHSHPDHFGGARRLRKETGAEIVTHRRFQNWWDASEEEADLDNPDVVDDPDFRPAYPDGERPRPGHGGRTPWGGSELKPPVKQSLKFRFNRRFRRNLFATPTPTVRLEEADTITLAGREWSAIFTPGHTPDHLCLYDPSSGTLLSGDHVLPTITPHISGIGSGQDPLARFFRSLERMHALEDVTTVLPAHGQPFSDLDGRVDAIRHHHEDRLEQLRKASEKLGHATVVDLSHELFRPQVWGPMAESEAFAHLEHLRLAGRAERTETAGVLSYTVH